MPNVAKDAEQLELSYMSSMKQTEPVTWEKYLTIPTRAKHMLILHPVTALQSFMLFHIWCSVLCFIGGVAFPLECVV